jgi:hypothetical protein
MAGEKWSLGTLLIDNGAFSAYRRPLGSVRPCIGVLSLRSGAMTRRGDGHDPNMSV